MLNYTINTSGNAGSAVSAYHTINNYRQKNKADYVAAINNSSIFNSSPSSSISYRSDNEIDKLLQQTMEGKASPGTAAPKASTAKKEPKDIDTSIQDGNSIAKQAIRPEKACVGVKEVDGKKYGVYLRGIDEESGFDWDFDPKKLEGKSSEEIEKLVQEGKLTVHCREIKEDGSLGEEAFNLGLEEASDKGFI
ncbi:MAG: hypothetical protein A2Y25_04045 [Candidatus Melainabacteria bacterium GWF2_37_15]|nr:MAG: hypothetical protein A2Y25_04045 [Candidatus Melainabacteria bacterium GWF2_37_15]